jgi:hypothetical protein
MKHLSPTLRLTALLLLTAITLLMANTISRTQPPNTGNLCMCMINTWTDYKGNSETIADFAEYSGVGTTLDEYRENKMKATLQKVFDNHTKIWDSYKSGFTSAYEGSCDEMRAKMKAEGITYQSSNTWPTY